MSSHSTTFLPWSRPVEASLDLLGPVDGLHVLIVGRGSLEPMLALHRRGAAQVTAIAASARVRAEAIDAVLVPCLDDPDHVGAVIDVVQRCIRPLNSVVILVPSRAPATVLPSARRALADQGFSVGRPIPLRAATALAADLPLYGRLKVA